MRLSCVWLRDRTRVLRCGRAWSRGRAQHHAEGRGQGRAGGGLAPRNTDENTPGRSRLHCNNCMKVTPRPQAHRPQERHHRNTNAHDSRLPLLCRLVFPARLTNHECNSLPAGCRLHAEAAAGAGRLPGGRRAALAAPQRLGAVQRHPVRGPAGQQQGGERCGGVGGGGRGRCGGGEGGGEGRRGGEEGREEGREEEREKGRGGAGGSVAVGAVWGPRVRETESERRVGGSGALAAQQHQQGIRVGRREWGGSGDKRGMRRQAGRPPEAA